MKLTTLLQWVIFVLLMSAFVVVTIVAFTLCDPKSVIAGQSIMAAFSAIFIYMSNEK